MHVLTSTPAVRLVYTIMAAQLTGIAIYRYNLASA